MQIVITSTIFALALLLSGCSLVYKPDIEQGNVVTAKQLETVKVGMTPRQVEFALGPPMLRHSLRPERWDYYYSLKRDTKPGMRSWVTLYFEADKLARIERRLEPEAAPE